jgi:hypothetical protein
MAQRGDVYLTTNKKQTPMPFPAGIEPTISGSGQLQTHALHCAATEIGASNIVFF